MLSQVLDKPDKARRYMERYVNNGSPSGFTLRYNTSQETHPMGRNPMFPLYFAQFAERTVSNLGTLPSYFNNCHQLLHPDMISCEIIKANCLSLKRSHLNVSPTSSSRTVEILPPGPSGYVKLNYRGMIGRVDRQLSKRHALSSIEITGILYETIKSQKLPVAFNFCPETGARIVTLRDNDGSEYEWGSVYREPRPFPQGISFSVIIPAFSLFSLDRNNVKDPCLLIQLIDGQDLSPEMYLLELLLFPIIESYFGMICNCALQPECHAQNILIGFDQKCSPIGIIIRDLESVDKDLYLAEVLGISTDFKSYPYKCLEVENYNYTIMHSFMYDFKLGEYLFTPMIDLVSNHYGISTRFFSDAVKSYAQRFIRMLPDWFFPKGVWYNYDNKVHSSGKRRHYNTHGNPKYR